MLLKNATWIQIPFATPPEVTGDFFILVTGAFLDYPGGTPHTTGYFNFEMLCDFANFIAIESSLKTHPKFHFKGEDR